MAPLSEGTVERSWSLGETDLVRSREARGAEAGGRAKGADMLVPGDDTRRQRLGRVS